MADVFERTAMATQNKSPYICHIFVCTNDRHGVRKSCADGNSPDIRAALKKAVADKGWKGKVRVSASGCLGLCEHGPNVILYPQQIWLSGVTAEDVSGIVEKIEGLDESLKN